MRLFSVFLGLTVLTEIFANLASGPLRWATNWPIYNSFMLPEYILYTLFFRSIIHNQRIKKVLNGFLVLIPIVWVISSFWLLGITVWNSYMVLIGDSLTIFMCTCYMYEFFLSEDEIDIKTSAEFWIAASTFMYACCEVPITGRLNYLAAHNEQATNWLLVIMYLTILYAYQCRRLINIMSS